MGFQALVHRKARAYYRELPEKTRNRIKNVLVQLSIDPVTPRPKADIKKLKGTKGRKHAYRIRAGDYRIVYDVQNKDVRVTLIFRRGKDYQELS